MNNWLSSYMETIRYDHVLDACSAPGGKACHIAEVLMPEGQVDASDIHSGIKTSAM
jgi:16S rRNA (cytosine967-C5)-methyltransferase